MIKLKAMLFGLMTILLNSVLILIGFVMLGERPDLLKVGVFMMITGVMNIISILLLILNLQE